MLLSPVNTAAKFSSDGVNSTDAENTSRSGLNAVIISQAIGNSRKNRIARMAAVRSSDPIPNLRGRGGAGRRGAVGGGPAGGLALRSGDTVVPLISPPVGPWRSGRAP